MERKSFQATPSRNSPFNRGAQHDAKRVAILSRAANLFNSKGSRSTTLTDIAQSLGLTKTSLYNYVQTKEELIHQCYMAALERHHRTLDAMELKHTAALQRISGFYLQQFENWLAAREGKDSYTAAFLEIASLKGSHREEVEALYLGMFKRLRQYLRDGMNDGSLRDCDATSAARGILGAVPWTFNWMREMSAEDVRAAACTGLDIITHGFSTAPGEYKFSSEALRPACDDDAATPDRKRHNRLKQEAFFRAGTWFFNRQGFNGTSLDQIAEHLHVSKGAFYYHIKNKEDLLLNCHLHSLDILDNIHLQAEALGGVGLNKVEQICRQTFSVQNSELGPLIRHRTLTALPPRRRNEVMKRRAASNHRFGDFLREGIDDGSVRPLDTLVVENLMAGVANAAMDMNAWRRIDDIDAAAVDYFDIFFNGLLPRGRPST